MDCEEYHRVAFIRSAQPLTFESSSGIFVGNAGGTGLQRFVVSVDVCVFVSLLATWALRYFLHCLLSALYNSCISAVLIPHPKRQWVWINDFEMNIESTASCRNKCGVWTVADFTSENEHNSLRWQLYDCHGRRGMNDQVYSWALLCPMRAPKWQAAYLHMCTRASSLIFEWFKLSAPVITAANSFPIKMRNQKIVNIKG